MTRPNPLLLYWHRLTSRGKESTRRRRRNALRVLEAARRSGNERRSSLRTGASESTETAAAAGFGWEKFARIGLAIVAAALLTALLCLWPNRLALRLGDIVTKDIIAQRTVRYADKIATEELRAAALKGVGRRYSLTPGATQNAIETTRSVFDIVERWATTGKTEETAGGTVALTPKRRVLLATEEIHRMGATGVSEATVAYLFNLPAATRANIRSAASTLTEQLMGRPISDENNELEANRRAVPTQKNLIELFPEQKMRAAVAQIVAASLIPNQHFDAGETARQQQDAQSSVPLQLRRISAGEPIIRVGERVTQQHLDAFAALGLQSARLDGASIAMIAAMVVGMVVFITAYLRLFHRKLYQNTRLLLLLAIFTVLAVGGLKVGSLLLGLPFSGVHFGYLGMMCVASAGMAIALLIDASVATLTVALLSIASGMILNNELRFTLLTLGSSLVGIVSVATLKDRNDYLRATLILCTVNAALNAMVGQLEGDQPNELISGALWGGISGLFAMALFYTGVAIFERWFGITTHLRLLELSDPATPILQEFRLKVPGTYAHSLMVGTLAHAAAEGIGADSLLVRVAAYYHDLGKMNRPEFFIENQSGLENVHDRISPSLSALVLVAHVKDGVEMGRAMGLPPRVLELIEQHHGSTLMRFFYHKATGGTSDAAMEAQFRYPGPKPQTKEAAILMLADSVEAASRSLEKPTPQRIADFVASIVEEKRADAQLDECDLTLWELKTVQETFARTLSGTLHARIAYPGDKYAVKDVSPSPLPAIADLPTPDVSFAPRPIREVPHPIVPVLTLATFDDAPGERQEIDAEVPALASAGRASRRTSRRKN